MEEQNNDLPKKEEKTTQPEGIENPSEQKEPEPLPSSTEQLAPVSSTPESSAPTAPPIKSSTIDLSQLHKDLDQVRDEMKKYLIGQYDMVDLLLVGLLADGHILLEGVPGIAKTLTSKLLAQTIKVDFSRVQFTPDLMPSDIVGTSVYSMKTNEFSFKKGPVFSNVVLIDEINRAPAKTQSALFEVMEERQITVDGRTHQMDYPFMVVATQNPVEQEGTYRLPEAQLDRFLFRIKLNYPSLEEEQAILHRFKDQPGINLSEVRHVLTADRLKAHRAKISQVKVENSIISYISQITHETRNHGKLYLGASPRASLAMMNAAKAFAAMRGRDFVIPDDVQFVAPHVLNHRIILNPEAEMEGMLPEHVISGIVKKIEVPR